jgi:hypothetical protein
MPTRPKPGNSQNNVLAPRVNCKYSSGTPASQAECLSAITHVMMTTAHNDKL